MAAENNTPSPQLLAGCSPGGARTSANGAGEGTEDWEWTPMSAGGVATTWFRPDWPPCRRRTRHSFSTRKEKREKRKEKRELLTLFL